MNESDGTALSPEERERQRRLREERRRRVVWLNRLVLFAFAVSAGRELGDIVLEVFDDET